MQIIPTNKPFGNSTPNWTDWPNMYMPVQTLTGTDTATGFSMLLNSGISYMHDGHRPVGAIGLSSLALPTATARCAVTDETAVTTTGDLGAHVFRPLVTSGTVKVTGMFSIMVVNNGPIPTGAGGGKRAWWVSARVQDGVQAGDILQRPSGYYFGMTGNAGAMKFQLLRANDTGASTTLTLLAEFPTVGTIGLSGFKPQSPYMIRLEVTTNGATVELRGYGENIPKTGAQSEGLFISYDDTSGSRLATAGRCGFVMNRELQEGSTDTITALDSLTIEDAGTVVLRDEFYRTNRLNCQSRTDAFGVVGRSVACDFDGDQFGDYNQKLLRSTDGTWTDRLQIDPAIAAVGNASDPSKGGWFLFQRPPTNHKSMHRSCTIVFQSTGTNPSNHRECGIALRWNGGTGSTMPASCYYASVRLTPSTSQIRLDRIATDPNTSQPTFKNIAILLAAGINEDQEYAFDFEVFSIANATSEPDGVVVCKVKLDAVQVVFTAGTVTQGITITAAGDVLDDSSERVKSGAGEGFRIYDPDGTRDVFFDTWQEESLTNVSGLPANDQTGIALLAETHNFTGSTLTMPLTWPAELEPNYQDIRVEFEDGYKATRARYPHERELWRVQAHRATTAEREALKTFWDTHDGTVKSFNWETPEGNTYKFHFKDDRLGTVLANPGVTRFSVVLERLFD